MKYVYRVECWNCDTDDREIMETNNPITAIDRFTQFIDTGYETTVTSGITGEILCRTNTDDPNEEWATTEWELMTWGYYHLWPQCTGEA